MAGHRHQILIYDTRGPGQEKRQTHILLWDRHSLFKMSDLERFGGKSVPILTPEAVARALGERGTLTGFTFLKGWRLEEVWSLCSQ